MEAGQRVNEILSQLPLQWMWKVSISTGVGFSEKAVWSRASRRQVARKQGESMEEHDDPEMAFGFKIHVVADPGGEPGSSVTIRWLKGHDSVIFESFCGMVKRKLEELIDR
jgi:23S rRNA (adenine1618-N6)-methyltransferase